MAKVTLKVQRVNNGLVRKTLAENPQVTRTMRGIVDDKIGKRAKEVAEHSYRAAIGNVVRILKFGIDGAENTRHRLIVPNGSLIKAADAHVNVDMPALREATLIRKVTTNAPGAGQMWRDSTRLADQVATAFADDAKQVKVKKRIYNRKKAYVNEQKILVEFLMDLDFEEIGEPLDTMLRRALMTGDPEAGRLTAEIGEGTRLWLLPLLSSTWKNKRTGTGVPARSFVPEMAARMGQIMFRDLFSLKPTE